MTSCDILTNLSITIMNEYDLQANTFAKKWGLTLSSRYVGCEKNKLWGSKGDMNRWKCTLRRGKVTYTFDFWMGLGLKGKPTMYEVLAALTHYDVGSFEDFCSEFGYNRSPLSDYPRVKKIYDGACREFKSVQRLFPEDEAMQELCEIC